MSQHLKNREGFALPMVIVVIAVLTAALAASFSSTNAELTTNSAERGQNRAFDIAEAGLEQFVVRRSPSWCVPVNAGCVADPSAVDSEYTRVTFTNGYADVVARRVRPIVGTDNAVFFIRSKGVDTTLSGRLNAAAGTVYAERTVGQYAKWMTTTMNVKAAWMSLSGLHKNGSSGKISGVDDCGKHADVAGVTVPKGSLTTSGSFSPTGTPPADTSQTLAQMKQSTDIDWAGIVNGGIDADITIPGQSFPSPSAFNDTSYWPVIHIHTNNYGLPNAGRGMIIADSNFSISGSNMWDGIILVGGQLTSNGNNTTSGATISGLNLILGGTADTSTINDINEATANGQKSYTFNSCNVSRATTKLQHYGVIPNSWVDNLASW